MQRTKKRKRGSPEPAPRPAASTASFSWRTLQPPRGTPRARGRGRSAGRRPIISKAKPRTEEVCQESEEEGEEEEEAAPEETSETPGQPSAMGGEPTTALPDEEIQRREEHYQELRSTMGMGDTHEGDEAPLAFSSDTLDQVQALWSPLTAGMLLARVGHFLRIMSQMMEEVGYLTEVLSPGHREVPPDDGSTTLMQREKRPQPATQRRRTPQETGSAVPEGEELSSSTSMAGPAGGRRNTRRDAVPREENLTAEGWAIMEAVERCPVWHTQILQPPGEGKAPRSSLHDTPRIGGGKQRKISLHLAGGLQRLGEKMGTR